MNTEKSLETTFDEVGLSKRQREIARALLDGHSHSIIGQSLFISESTVKGHCSDIYPRMGVKTRKGLVHKFLWARQAELAIEELKRLNQNVAEVDEIFNSGRTRETHRKRKAKALRAFDRRAFNG